MEMQIKATMAYHYSSIRVTKVEKDWQHQMLDVMQLEPSQTVSGIYNGPTTLENRLAVLKNLLYTYDMI